MTLTANNPPAHRYRKADLIVPFLTLLFDAIAIEGAFLFSYWLRSRSGLFDFLGFVDVEAPPISAYLLGSLFVVPVWVMLFNARKMYAVRRNVSLSDELINIVKVVTLGMLIVMSAAFFYREFSYSRIVFGLLWGTAIGLIFIGRAAVHGLERRWYRRGKHLQNAIIIGNDALAEQVYTKLNGHPSFGFRVLGYLADRTAPAHSPLAAASYLGTLSDTVECIKNRHVELVFIALRAKEHDALFEIVAECEGINVEFMMVPDVLEILTSQVTLREIDGIPLLRIKNISLTTWGRILKRTTDLVLSAFLLLLLSPLLLVISILVRSTSRGPVFFGQVRVGLDGRQFTMYKFRSMKADAEAETGPVWTGKNDPRRTRIGAFLRKTSLDELPQLFNVLRGEMSLVGPRPERPHFVTQFRNLVPKYLDRHRVKTGMTGWAQVNGLRGNTSLEERIKYDLYYIENWSLAFDFKILLRTLKAAFNSRESG